MATFLSDKNASAILVAIDAAMVFFDRAHPSIARPAVKGSCAAVISTALPGRPVAKNKGIELFKLCVHIEAGDETLAALIEGFQHKNPKIISSCLAIVTELLKEYGGRVVQPKPILAQLAPLFDKTDDGIRKEVQTLAVELYRWGFGAVLSTQLADIRPAQLKSLQARYEEVDAQLKASGKPVPSRFLRSQDPSLMAPAGPGGGGEPGARGGTEEETGRGEGDEGDDAATDPYFLVDPVAFAAQLHAEWYGRLGDKKWGERRDALDDLLKWTDKPRLASGNYAELCKALRGIVDADINQMVVRKAVLALGNLVNGLRAEFSKEARASVMSLLNKFKDKKGDIVSAVSDTLDACIARQCFAVADVHKEIAAALDSKVPSIRHQTYLWLHRTARALRHDALLQAYKLIAGWCADLGLNDTALEVRDAAADAFAALVSRLGERTLSPFLERLDALKLKKVKSLLSQSPAAAKPPAAAPPPVEPKAAAPLAEARARRAPGLPKAAAPAKSAPKPKPPAAEQPAEEAPLLSIADYNLISAEEALPRLSAEVGIEPRVLEQLGTARDIPAKASAVKQLAHALQQVIEAEQGLSSESAELLLALLSARPGWKESSDVRILDPMMSLSATILRSTLMPQQPLLFYLLDPLLSKMTNAKLERPINDCLFALAESLSPAFVFAQIFQRNSPSVNFKILVTSTQWIAQCIVEFGPAALSAARLLVPNLKSLLSSSNNFVRDAAVLALATLARGLPVSSHPTLLSEVKPPALATRLEKALHEATASKLPAPVRFVRDGSSMAVSRPVISASTALPPPAAQSVDPPTPTQQFWKTLKTENILNNLSDLQNIGPCRAASKRLEAILAMPVYLQLDGMQCSADCLVLLEKLRERLSLAPGSTATAALIPSFLQVLLLLGQALTHKPEQALAIVFQPLFLSLGDSNKTISNTAEQALTAWTNSPNFSFLESILPLLSSAAGFGLKARQIEWLMSDAHLPSCLGQNCSPEFFNPLLKPALDCLLNDSREVQKLGVQFLECVMRESEFDFLKQVYKTYTKAASQKLLPVITAVRKNIAKGSSEPATPSKKSGIMEPFALEKKTRLQQFSEQSPLCPTFRFPPVDQPPNGEFVQLLSEALRQLLPGPTFSLMFSREPDSRVKALELVAAMSANPTEFLPSSDIIFLWFMANLFSSSEANRRIALEKVLCIVKNFEREQIALTDLDFHSFFPYLLARSDSEITSLVNVIPLLIRPLCSIYPRSKVFTALLMSLKQPLSHNKRELHIDILTDLLQRHGISVIQDISLTYVLMGELLAASSALEAEKILHFFAVAHTHSPDPDATFWTVLHNILPKPQLDQLVAHISPSNKKNPRPVTPSTPPQPHRSSPRPITPFGSLSMISPSKITNVPTNSKSIGEWVAELSRTDRDPNTMIETLKYICIALDNSANMAAFSPLVDRLVVGLDRQLAHGLILTALNPRFCKYLINALIYVFKEPQLARLISSDTLQLVLQHALEHLARTNWESISDGDYLRKAYNIFILKTIENANLNFIFVILIDFLSAHAARSEDQADTLLTDLIMKCLLTMSDALPSNIDRIDDLASILLALHRFLCAHPPSKWRSATETKIPLKTIRAILNQLVNLKGSQIDDHLYLLPDDPEGPAPILRSYINTILGRVDPKMPGETPMSNASQDISIGTQVSTPSSTSTTSSNSTIPSTSIPSTPVHTSSILPRSFDSVQTPTATPSAQPTSTPSGLANAASTTSPPTISIADKLQQLRERSRMAMRTPATPASRATRKTPKPDSPPAESPAPRSENLLTSNEGVIKMANLRARLQAAKEKVNQISASEMPEESFAARQARWADIRVGLSLPVDFIPRSLSELSHSFEHIKTTSQ